jgi:hypothetical protein
MNMLDLEIVIAHTKNNISQGYDEICVNMIKVVGPVGMQWLYSTWPLIWKAWELRLFGF